MQDHDKGVAVYAAIAVAVAVALALAAGYLWYAQSSPHPPESLHRVTIANTGYAGTCPVLAAQENGYFESEGVQVTIQPHTTGKAALDATLRGQADLGTSADLPIMFAAVKRQPVSVIASIFTAQKDYGVVGRKDKGVTAAVALRGKRVGVTLTTSGHFFLDAFLNRQQLSANDVKVRDLKPENLAAALIRGDIDAAATWEPYLGEMRQRLGNNAALFSADGVYDSIYNISGTRDYVTSHPETIKKVLLALIRGARFCKESPDAASEIVGRIINTDVEQLRRYWSTYRFNISLDQSLLLTLEDETRWAMKNKLTSETGMPNYLNYIYLDGLLAVAPTTVTVVH